MLQLIVEIVGLDGGEEAEAAQVDGEQRDVVVDGGARGAEQRAVATQKKAVYADRIDQRNDRGVFDHTNPTASQVEDPETHKFGEEQNLIRHR